MWAFPEIYQLGDIPRYHARNRPDATAILEAGHRMSWRELDLESNRVANALLSTRFQIEDCIGFLGKNTRFFAIALLGVSKAGMTFMPLNWRLAAAELAAILRDSECKLMFVESEFLALAADALQRADIRLQVVELTRQSANDPAAIGFLRGASTEDPLLSVPSTVTALRVYTSGTTGLPKGVELSHENFNMTRLCEHFEPAILWSEEDVFLMFMPNFHTAGAGLMLQSLYNGSAVSMLHAFEPAIVLRAIQRLDPTILLIVPSALQMLLDHPTAKETDFSCLKLCMYAGSPISLPLIRRAMAEMRCSFVQWYGATETVSAVTLLRAHQHHLDDEQKLKSCGTPLPLVSLRVVDLERRRRPPRGGWGNMGANADPVQRLLEETGGNGEGQTERVVSHRRRGISGHGGLSLHPRSREGYDRLGRRECVLGGNRAHTGEASGGCPGGRNRRP